MRDAMLSRLSRPPNILRVIAPIRFPANEDYYAMRGVAFCFFLIFPFYF